MKDFVLIKGIPVPNTHIVSDIPFTRQQLEAALKELNEPDPPKPGQRYVSHSGETYMFVNPERVTILAGNTKETHPFAKVNLRTGELSRISKEEALGAKLT